MSGTLIAIAVGPVQDFIYSARRTRDLWFGSQILSEISKAVAVTVHGLGGTLIFPGAEQPADLDGATVANVILAEFPGPVDAKDVASKAKVAAEKFWESTAESARTRAGKLIREEIWTDQVGGVVECVSAWGPARIDGDYGKARKRVMRLLAGRKALRDFAAAPTKVPMGVPKSSLDGARESVIDNQERASLRGDLKMELRLSDGEELDSVGVTKRLAVIQGLGELRFYPSVARIAADPWLRGVQKNDPDLLNGLKQVTEGMPRGAISAVKHRQFAAFPYDGTAIYVDRYDELVNERDASPADTEKLRGLLKKARFKTPDPYLAILAADGDQMGKALSNLSKGRDPEPHRAFSKKLAEFAGQAREDVERANGTLVFAGGDDVLALLPLDHVVACARLLRDHFDDVVKLQIPGDDRPTLSVGIAIGHFMEPMEDLLSYARAAEKHAKKGERDLDNGRNSLAIHFHPRGGVPVQIRDSWKNSPDEVLISLAEAHAQDMIPSKAAYDLRDLAMHYERWPVDPLEAMKADARRLLARKRTKKNEEQFARLWARIEAHVLDWRDLVRLAEEIIISSKIATAMNQAGWEKANG